MAETPERLAPTKPGEAEFIHTLKRAASVLKRTDVPFALAGGFAAYARGGTSSDHDVDFLIREQDAGTALAALTDAGFRTERPPEDWLVKAYDGDRLVDLIFRPVERPVTDETLALADPMRVDSILVPVMPATTLMVHKMLTFSQHYCDFAKALPIARSLREQIDWDVVRQEPAESPYAQAFLFLLDRLVVLSHRPRPPIEDRHSPDRLRSGRPGADPLPGSGPEPQPQPRSRTSTAGRVLLTREAG